MRKKVKSVFDELMAGKIEPVEYFEIPIITKKGKERIIELHNTILKDEQGNIYATLSSGLDITERKQAEQKLKESEKRYKKISDDLDIILDGVPGLIFYKDTENNFIRVNKYVADAHNMTKEELAGKSCFDIYLHDQAQTYWDDDLEVIKSGKPKLFIEEPWDTDKGRRWVSTSKIPFVDEKGEIIGIIGFSIDITERKKAEEKLKESEEKYRVAYNRAEFYKDIFAHDINNLLQNIKSSMELLSTFKNIPEKSDEVNELTNIIEEQVVRGTKLVWNIRKLSQIEETESSLEPVEIFQVLKEAINFIQKSYHNKDIEIQIDSQIKQGFVQANGLLLDLFENILFNAVKHNENPKIEISVKASKVDKDGKKYLKFEFLDNGIGVPDALKEQLFKDISSIKRKTKGMGLGLLLVSKILSIYEGQIWVEDKIKGDPSKGSSFIILLPEVL